MKPSTLIATGVASLALIGYAVCSLGGGSGKSERPAPVAGDSGAGRPDDAARRATARDDGRPGDQDGARDALAIALRSRLERALDAPDEEPPLPTVESRVEAEAAFEVVMQSVEELAEKGGRVSKRRKARLYRAANDAFAALSEHLDPSSRRDLAQLEEAHVRLKHMLREIDAGPPGPLQPP